MTKNSPGTPQAENPHHPQHAAVGSAAAITHTSSFRSSTSMPQPWHFHPTPDTCATSLLCYSRNRKKKMKLTTAQLSPGPTDFIEALLSCKCNYFLLASRARCQHCVYGSEFPSCLPLYAHYSYTNFFWGFQIHRNTHYTVYTFIHKQTYQATYRNAYIKPTLP